MYGEREEREDGRAYRTQYRSQACDPGVEERVFEWVAFLVLHLYEIEEHYHAHETRRWALTTRRLHWRVQEWLRRSRSLV